MKKTKVGIIGVGRMGQYHLNIISNLPDVNLIGISDLNKERLTELSYKFNVDGYDNYKKLIKKCDALFIATPTSTHYEYAKECLEARKHILLEKPMTTNLEEAKELVRLSKKMDLILQIGHVERFNGASRLKAISVDEFLTKFVSSLFHTASARTIISAFYIFLLEFEERLNELNLRSTGGGSIGPLMEPVAEILAIA